MALLKNSNLGTELVNAVKQGLNSPVQASLHALAR